MTYTPQSVRGQTQQLTEIDYWQKCRLPVDINTATKSKAFIKKVMQIAFSNVCYLRTNFPEDAFKNADLGSRIPIRMLKKSNWEASNTMIANMKGAVDAFDRGYLKQLEIVIREGGPTGESGDTVLETYTFDLDTCNSEEFFTTMLKSGKSQASKNIKLTREQMMANEKDQTTAMALLRKATRCFMRELSGAIEGLAMLPDSAVMEMHIVYDPDTPDEYQAPGFEETTQVVKIRARAGQDLFKKKFNALPTPYHKVQLGVKSILPCEENQPPSATQGEEELEQDVAESVGSTKERAPELNTTEEFDETAHPKQDLDVSIATTVPVPTRSSVVAESISTIAPLQAAKHDDNEADRSTVEAGSPDYISPTPTQSNSQKKPQHHRQGRGDAASAIGNLPGYKNDDVDMMDAEDEDSSREKVQKQQSRKSKSKRSRDVRDKENQEEAAFMNPAVNPPAKRAKAKRSHYV